MALKRLKTREFGRNPDHLPENCKNALEMGGLALESVRQRSKWAESKC